MPSIEWSDAFSVNIKELDEDHKELLGIINEFNGAVMAGTVQEIISKIIDDLFDFSETHFAREETLMKEHDFPGYLEHKYKHNGIIEDLFDILKRHRSSENEIESRIAFLLGDWLLNHTSKEDKKVGEYLSRKGVT